MFPSLRFAFGRMESPVFRSSERRLAHCIIRFACRAVCRATGMITDRTTRHTGAFMKGSAMHQIIYIVGAIVLVIALLSFVGLR